MTITSVGKEMRKHLFLYNAVKVKNVKVLVAQSCPTLCNPIGCTPLGSSVHEFL